MGRRLLLAPKGKTKVMVPFDVKEKMVWWWYHHPSWWKNVKETRRHPTEPSGSNESVERCENDSLSSIAIRETISATTLTPSGEPAPPTKLFHVAQQETWDCGIACLLMVWSWIVTSPLHHPSREAVDRKRIDILSHMQAGTSIWTIDLVYVLDQWMRQAQHPFEFEFYSKTLETNNAWSTLTYYAATFPQDRQRTQRRFLTLQEKGRQADNKQRLHLLQHTNDSMDWIMHRIQRSNVVAIVLVDKTILDKTPQQTHDTVVASSSPEYSGHYVVVIGVIASASPKTNREGQSDSTDSDDIQLCIMDPDKGVWQVPMRQLELAWHAEGTDHDVIFVEKSSIQND